MEKKRRMWLETPNYLQEKYADKIDLGSHHPIDVFNILLEVKKETKNLLEKEIKKYEGFDTRKIIALENCVEDLSVVIGKINREYVLKVMELGINHNLSLLAYQVYQYAKEVYFYFSKYHTKDESVLKKIEERILTQYKENQNEQHYCK